MNFHSYFAEIFWEGFYISGYVLLHQKMIMREWRVWDDIFKHKLLWSYQIIHQHLLWCKMKIMQSLDLIRNSLLGTKLACVLKKFVVHIIRNDKSSVTPNWSSIPWFKFLITIHKTLRTIALSLQQKDRLHIE